MKYLLDTNVFREIGKTEPHAHVSAWLQEIDDADLAISVLTIREIAKGIARLAISKPDVATQIATRTRIAFDAFAGRILPIDRRIAQEWGEALAEREKHIEDTALAVTARIHHLVLVTRNTKDVGKRNVPVLNPYKSPPEYIS